MGLYARVGEWGEAVMRRLKRSALVREWKGKLTDGATRTGRARKGKCGAIRKPKDEKKRYWSKI